MLTERIVRAIETDENDPKDADAKARRVYEAATPDQQAVIDRVFVSLCGWRFKTLMAEKKK